MSNKIEPQSRTDIEAKIIAKAWKEESYKQRLLANPKAVIEREFGIQLPSEINVQVQEENHSNLYFVLPMRPQIEGVELNEEELEEIAGGGTPSALLSVSVWISAEYTIKNHVSPSVSIEL